MKRVTVTKILTLMVLWMASFKALAFAPVVVPCLNSIAACAVEHLGKAIPFPLQGNIPVPASGVVFFEGQYYMPGEIVPYERIAAIKAAQIESDGLFRVVARSTAVTAVGTSFEVASAAFVERSAVAMVVKTLAHPVVGLILTAGWYLYEYFETMRQGIELNMISGLLYKPGVIATEHQMQQVDIPGQYMWWPINMRPSDFEVCRALPCPPIMVYPMYQVWNHTYWVAECISYSAADACYSPVDEALKMAICEPFLNNGGYNCRYGVYAYALAELAVYFSEGLLTRPGIYKTVMWDDVAAQGLLTELELIQAIQAALITDAVALRVLEEALEADAEILPELPVLQEPITVLSEPLVLQEMIDEDGNLWEEKAWVLDELAPGPTVSFGFYLFEDVITQVYLNDEPWGEPVHHPRAPRVRPVVVGKVQCEEYPASLSCADMDDQEPEEKDNKQKVIDQIAPIGLGGGGSCPSSQQFSVFGKTFHIDYAPACEYATMLKPVVVAICWVISGYIVFGIKRRNETDLDED